MPIQYRKRIPAKDDDYLYQLSKKQLAHFVPAWMWKENRFIHELNRSSRIIIVTKHDGETPIGYVAYSWRTDQIVHIDYAVLETHYQGKGYARQGLEQLKRYLKSKGATTIQLYVHHNNRSALGIYRHLGFKNIQRPTPFRSTYWMELIL